MVAMGEGEGGELARDLFERVEISGEGGFEFKDFVVGEADDFLVFGVGGFEDFAVAFEFAFAQDPIEGDGDPGDGNQSNGPGDRTA